MKTSLIHEYLGQEMGETPGGGRSLSPGVSPSLSISHKSDSTLKDETNKLQGSHKRMSEVIAQEVFKLVKVFGIERLGFFTLTFAEDVKTPREANRRFKNLLDGVLRGRYCRGFRVLERGETNGRLHYHVVIVLDRDIRTGFDFEAITRRDYRSANEFLASEWKFWLETAPKYGFGRTELLPIKSTAEGIARYVGSYVGKHVRARLDVDKGARLVGFWGYREKAIDSKTGESYFHTSARASTANFAYLTENGFLWRFKVAKFAASVGAKTTDQLKAVYGPKWCYLFYEEIMLQRIDGMDGLDSPVCVSEKAALYDAEMRFQIEERESARKAAKSELQVWKWENVCNPGTVLKRFERRQLCVQVARELRGQIERGECVIGT